MKGASSIEYLFVTGIALAALSIFIVISMNISNDSIRIAQAKNAVETLAKSADYVNSLGAGSKETVSVFLPKGVGAIDVFNNTVHMRVALSSGDSDVYAKGNGKLVGKVDPVPGEQRVPITALPDGRVLFGDALLDCTPARISLNIPYNGANSSGVKIQNIALYPLSNLTATVTGSVSSIATYPQPSPQSLAPGENATLSLQFSPGGSTGIYSGLLNVEGSNGSSCYTELFINSFDNSTVPQNASDNIPPYVHLSLFGVCQSLALNAVADDTGRGDNFIANCEYAVDGGTWSLMSPADGAWLDSKIELANATVHIYDNSTHDISVRCMDSNGNTGNATVQKSCTPDNTGPLSMITGVLPLPNATTDDDVTVNANCNDTTTGGSLIRGAEISFDNSSIWHYMNAANGFFNDSIAIGVTFTTTTPMPSGRHGVQVRCIDSSGNTGGEANATFYVINTVDYSGPIISDMGHDPDFITTIANISIHANATDEYTGGSNISGCMWKMNGTSGTQWANASSADGAYNSPAEGVAIPIGKLNPGYYTVQLYCTDSKGNAGAVHSDGFRVVMGDIMLIMDRSGSMNDPIGGSGGPQSKNGGSFADSADIGTASWSSPSNAQFSDNLNATATLGSGVSSHYLKATGFGFSVPSNAVISGIEVRIEKSASGSNVRDYSVHLLKGGSPSGNDDADTSTNWGTSDSVITYGGSSDTWGTSWVPSDINNGNFGVAISARQSSGSSARAARVDYMNITVYYTISGPTKMQSTKNAANSFVDMVDSSAQVGLVSYSTSAVLNRQLALMTSTNKNTLKTSLNSLSPSGNTCIWCGLNTGVSEITSARSRYPNAARMIILMTDGQNNVCNEYPSGSTACETLDQDEMVAAAVNARDNNVRVYTIGFGDEDEIDPVELTDMALLTGGKYYYAPDEATLQYIYQHIGE
ncbi:von Willebrand factor type A domain protein [uncultured archaeon]|nr:von Willebrand factor type A domain protein [uncultured archaeon]